MPDHDLDSACGVPSALGTVRRDAAHQHEAGTTVPCPGCGTANPADAVFCINDECHKALGEFRYVLEELRARRSRFERLADRVATFSGHPHFVTVHLAWFLVWILLNSGLVAFFHVFDEYPFGLLGIILSIEAILVSSFVLISQNRQSAYSDLRAELDYEISIQTFRRIEAIEGHLARLVEVAGTARVNSAVTDGPAGPE